MRPSPRDAGLWTAPHDYAACQQLGAAARGANIEVIRYQSVRDPEHGLCAAVLTPAVFTAAPLLEQTWRLTVTRARIQWQRDSALHLENFEFAAIQG